MKCPCEKQCGGCQTLDCQPALIRKKKKDLVQSLLDKNHLRARVSRVHMASRDTHYRNKVIVGFAKKKGKVTAGLYAQGSHRIVPNENCLMQPTIVNELIQRIAQLVQSMKIELYNEKTGTGTLRHVLIRYSESTDQILIVFVSATRTFPSRKNLVRELTKQFKQIRSIYHSVNSRQTSVVLEQEGTCIYGDGHISDFLCHYTFTFGPSSFYQIHHDQCEVLYTRAKELLGCTGKEVLLDTYCGIGTIGTVLADSCQQVLGVERNRQSIQYARLNQKQNRIRNIDFICEDSTTFMRQAAEHSMKVDVLVLDPPRAGTTQAFIRSAFQLKPEKICYISCDPYTLVRDLKQFSKRYNIQAIELVDMFPYTKHVETVVYLSKLKSDEHVKVEVDMSEFEPTGSERRKLGTYEEIKKYILEKYGFKVPTLYISQIKKKVGVDLRPNYNPPKNEKYKQPQCTPEKEAAIMDALKYFKYIE